MSQLVLQSIEHCKRIQPIMEEFGIKPDGYINEDSIPTYPTYRQDKLELVLPEWWDHACFEYYRAPSWATEQQIEQWGNLPEADDVDVWSEYENGVIRKVENLTYRMLQREDLELKRQATTDLICLLDENNLLNKRQDGNLGS